MQFTPESAVETKQSQLRRDLLAARTQNLERLDTYIRQGAFPVNQVQQGMLNVFRDNEEHLCAVANLIALDGHTALINTTAANDNFIVLANVHEGPLQEWILASGFTQEEIGMIQKPYMGEFNNERPIVNPVEIATFREQEVERLQHVLRGVHTQISENTNASIEVAIRRATPIAFASAPR